jgi:uncharacterized protein (TIGR02145 family)
MADYDYRTYRGDYTEWYCLQFYGNFKIAEVVIEEGVTYIGDYAFAGLRYLASVTIPASVAAIGMNAFEGSGMKAVKVAADNARYSSEDGILFNKDKTTLLLYPVGELHAGGLPLDNKEGAYTIPSTVTAIGEGAFAYSTIGSIIIPNGVADIRERAFYSCRNLTSMTIPGSVKTIGENAFAACAALKSVIIDEGAASIGAGAFKDCYRLTSMAVPASVASVGEGAFYFDDNASVTVGRRKPPKVDGYTLGKWTTKTCLYVPASGIEAYRADSLWGEFPFIEAIAPDETASGGNGGARAALCILAALILAGAVFLIIKKTRRRLLMLPLLPATLAIGAVCAQGCSKQSDIEMSDTFTDGRDGQKYRKITVDGDVWMAENLRYKTGESWCYDDDESKCRQYGRLYDWKTATGACPPGWHLASLTEWTFLLTKREDTKYKSYIGSGGVKAKSGWDGGGNGTDNYGFSALPGGIRNPDGVSYNAGCVGSWWAAEGFFVHSENFLRMNCNDNHVNFGTYYKNYGFSARCVKGEAEER